MARIAFIQLNEYELHGLEAIAGELQAKGHIVRVIIPFFERYPLRKIEKFNPDAIGFSLTSVERAEAVAFARELKKRFKSWIIFGGVDPSFFPEVINEDAVDVVCIGEGERALSSFLTALDKDGEFCKIDSLWVKYKGEIYRNPVGGLISELDHLAFPSKEIYFSHYRYYRDYPIKFFMASRGCPYNCSYCANQGLRALYPKGSKYVRFKSPDYLLYEMKRVLRNYPARVIGFNDDLFSFDLNWMEKFLPLYRREIGLPFFCCGRIDGITEDKARLLKESGCYSLWYGLETASEKNRREILNRAIKNEEIERGVEILRKYKIKLQSYNMLNYPSETLEEGLATLELNHKLKNDFVVSSLFQPFPGTELFRRLKENGELKTDDTLYSRKDLSYFAFSPYRQGSTKSLENLHKLFILGHRFGFCRKFLKFLVKLPKNPLFDILFIISFGIEYGRVHRLKWWEVIKYNVFHLRTTYIPSKPKVPRR